MDSRIIGAALLFGVGLARTGRAELPLPNATLSVKNPPSLPDCVDEAALAARIQAQATNLAPSDVAVAPLRLEVTIQRTRTALVAELRVSGRGGGIRQIEAARCQGLGEALAVTAAMILDREAQQSRSDTAISALQPDEATVAGSTGASVATDTSTSNGTPGAASDPKSPTPNDANPSRETKASREAKSPDSAEIPADRRGFRGIRLASDQELRASLAGGWGSPGSWHFEIGGEFGVRPWAAQLGVLVQPTHTIRLGAGRVELTTFAGIAAGCRRFGSDFRVVSCLRTTVGLERIEGVGFDQAPGKQLLVASLGPTLGVETGQRWVMGLDLLGQAGLLRDHYVVENPRETVKAPLFAVWLVARVAFSSRSASSKP